MSLGKHLGIAILVGSVLGFAPGCSGGGSSGSTNTIAVAVQDLALDPFGETTVLSFVSTSGIGAATIANFESDGGQSPQSVVVVADEVTIVWDERVTPSDQVRAIDLSGVSNAWRPVTTTDPAAPTFAITDADQNAGVGNDTLTVAFSGAYVVEETAEDLASWTLTVDGVDLDLAGSTFDFDANTQELAIDLGPLAHLHADFELAAGGVLSVADVPVSSSAVAGVASGDASSPALVSAVQNLSADEFGRVVDYTFDEPMSPVFATSLAQFDAADPDFAIEVTQPSDSVLRVRFNNPMVPGVDTVDLLDLADLHGNAATFPAEAITQPSPVANAYSGNVLGVTVENEGGDYLSIVTTQAFDPDSAVDPARWTLTMAGNPVTMADQEFSYDLESKTLTITLDYDAQNGHTFTIIGNGVLDVDGQPFNAGQFNTVSGETAAPTVVSVTQNRTLDARGRMLDVQLSEDVLEAAAETLGNWTISGAQTLQSATLLPGLDRVRLVYDTLVIPGETTLTVDALVDLAGNAMAAPQVGLAIGSTDTTAPSATSATATGVAGANDDTLAVAFDDDMIPAEVTDVANWQVESPVGVPVSTAGATAAWNGVSRTATLTFANGFDFTRGDDFRVSFVAARDLGGNVVTAAAQTGTVVTETVLPAVHAVYRENSVQDELVVRFSEPCKGTDDLWHATNNPGGARYVLRDSNGLLRGYAGSATELDDGLGVRVSFGVVVAASDEIDVAGVTDRAGNPLFPVFGLATVAEDTATPGLDLGFSTFTSVTGEGNDQITVVFDRPMSPWLATSPASYQVTGTGPVSLAGCELSFDGTSTVTIGLATAGGHDLQTGSGYDLSAVGVWSAQGAELTVASSDLGVVAGGDAQAPTVAVGDVRLHPTDPTSLLITTDEAVDLAAAETPGNYDYDNGNLAVSATRVSPRTIRATFAVAPVVGNDLDLVVADLAGNATGTLTRAVAAADVAPPLVTSVSGTITPGWGGDRITVVFGEPVSASSAITLANYSVLNGTQPLSLAGATATHASSTNSVTLRLAGGVELDAAQPVSVTIQGVSDVAGNAIAAPVQTAGPVGGDTTPPAFVSAFVDWDADPLGGVVQVLFSEDVDAAFATSAGNWTATGTSVLSVTLPARNQARVELGAALSASGTLGVTGLQDLARNASAAISVDPLE